MTETKDPRPRERKDVDEAIRKMNASLDSERRPIHRRLLSFQTFVSVLLIVLVIITTTSFAFTMSAEREAREQAEARRELFENHVADILASVRESQQEAHEEREEIYQELLNIHTEMVDRMNEVLDAHP
jgi:uncharacterized protein YlxW (UPF0749 family)